MKNSKIFDNGQNENHVQVTENLFIPTGQMIFWNKISLVIHLYGQKRNNTLLNKNKDKKIVETINKKHILIKVFNQ